MSIASSSFRITFGNTAPKVVEQPSPPSALNFLVAVAYANVRRYTAATLGLTGFEVKSAGSGQFSTIEIGQTVDKDLVAVKHSRRLAQPLAEPDAGVFDEHLNQICLELRILSHNALRKHANILNLLGICADEYVGRASISLVLEYSPFGNLDSFLSNHEGELSSIVCTGLVLQVLNGLEALHGLKICHGDVKTQNTLVFEEDGDWRVKLSDFGQSVVASQHNPSALSGYPRGTTIYNAPEIRRGEAFDDEKIFDIDAALLTDVFSFGLLTWEILGHGRSFLDSFWAKPADSTVVLDEVMDYLHALPQNGLCKLGLVFLENLSLSTGTQKVASKILEHSLEDKPSRRSTMAMIRATLMQEGLIEDLKLKAIMLDCADKESSGPPLYMYSTRQSLFEIKEDGFKNGIVIEHLPRSIQEQVASDLKLLADSEHLPRDVRAHAAMTISECYSTGFGVTRSGQDTGHWLLQAAINHHFKAAQWYHRICTAVGYDCDARDETRTIEDLESDLASLPTELYLSYRIRGLESLSVQMARSIFAESICHWPADQRSDFCFTRPFFNSWTMDELLPLHYATWTGDEARVVDLLRTTSLDVQSKQGLTAVHYACIGGHISTLKLLVSAGASVANKSASGVTPLHLGIFFSPDNAASAVDLLLKHGALPDERTEESISWDDHDIILQGTPLDWAVLTRNKHLVEILLPRTKRRDCIQIAISHFFWEVVEMVLQQTADISSLTPFLRGYESIRQPFAHWIAHGRDHQIAIVQTAQVCHRYSLQEPILQNDFTSLMYLINRSTVEDDFKLIEIVLSHKSDAEVKMLTDEGSSALLYAIAKANHDEMWLNTLKLLVQRYTVHELEAQVIFEGSYLHSAVTTDSVVGARVLLEAGVNVNQPTFDESASTALRLCMEVSRSLAMFNLLIEFGASQDVRYQVGRANPILAQLLGIQRSSQLQDLALQDDFPEEFWKTSLRYLLGASRKTPENARQNVQEAFAYLLTKKGAVKHINTPDAYGVTLIQSAAYHLNDHCLDLLLEAGADAGVPLRVGELDVYPLQIACALGRLLWLIYISNEQEVMPRERKNAFRVARKLLSWHRARGQSHFEGITPLHLASHMTIASEIDRLVSAGHNPHAKGRWPSLSHEVTPRELMEAPLPDDIGALEVLDREFAHDHDEAGPVVRPSWQFDPESINAAHADIGKSLSSNET